MSTTPPQLDALPRLGWVPSPSPITALPGLADALQLPWLGVKRDDLLPTLFGGTKVRKLDHLLARPPALGARRLASVGAIGSGHLVSLCAAGARLGFEVEAHLFWEPPSPHLLAQLAYIASHATQLVFHENRARLAMAAPRLLRGGARPLGLKVAIGPGATGPVAMLGLVHAAFELATQVRDGALPTPKHLYVPLGSGGTAAGLMVGLGLAGLYPTVHAVATVERWAAPPGRIGALMRHLLRTLDHAGLDLSSFRRPPLRVTFAHVGRGYGHPTQAGAAAMARLDAYDLGLEAVYSAKAMAALLSDPPDGPTLFWLTPRRAGPLPHDPDWRDRLPTRLRDRLDSARSPTRRHVLVGAAAALTLGVGLRWVGTPAYAGWAGQVLSAREASVVHAAARALLPHARADELSRVAPHVDRYLSVQPGRTRLDVHLLLGAVEHGGLMAGHLARLTAMSQTDAAAYLDALSAAGGTRRLLFGGLRDLCMLGYYQQPTAWPALGYEGPMVVATSRPSPYDTLRAPPTQSPPGFTEAQP